MKYKITLIQTKDIWLDEKSLAVLFVAYQSLEDLSLHSREFHCDALKATLNDFFKTLDIDINKNVSVDDIKRAIIIKFKKQHTYSYGGTERRLWLYMDRLTTPEYMAKVREKIQRNY